MTIISKEVKVIVVNEVEERRRQLKAILAVATGDISKADAEVARCTAIKSDVEKKLVALAAVYPEPIATEER